MPQPPAYMCCVVCGKTRKQHDHANRLVLPKDRHQWETPQTRDARLRKETNQSALFERPNDE